MPRKSTIARARARRDLESALSWLEFVKREQPPAALVEGLPPEKLVALQAATDRLARAARSFLEVSRDPRAPGG